jgi:hypothetical protein
VNSSASFFLDRVDFCVEMSTHIDNMTTKNSKVLLLFLILDHTTLSGIFDFCCLVRSTFCGKVFLFFEE